MEQKNIDRLFQEKLKDLEVTPNTKVWNNIASKLKKKKRRVLPMWWFYGGVAAILILGLFLSPFSNTTNNQKELPLIIAAPEIKTNTINSIKKETDTLFNNKKEETIIVQEIKKIIPKKQNNKFKKYNILIADKTQQNLEKEIKDSVSKKAMKKIFLTENNIRKVLDSIKNEIIIAQENAKDKIQKNINVKKTDSISKVKKAIKTSKKDILIAVNNKVVKEKRKKKKLWSISPVVALLNANSFSKASPINANLAGSTKGNNSYSYGVQVGYRLNNKWTVQSGLHLQDVHFSNNQVAVTSSSSIKSSIAFDSGDTFTLNDFSSPNVDLSALSVNAISLDGNLDQKYGYIEIPLEVKYNLLESKKLKTQIVAGFSSLFLNKNTIQLNANTISRNGKATNLNSINFSGNFGFDFNYKFDKNWSLNLNPMIKTQLNTYSENSNGFKPYFIGVYTGINYQF